MRQHTVPFCTQRYLVQHSPSNKARTHPDEPWDTAENTLLLGLLWWWEWWVVARRRCVVLLVRPCWHGLQSVGDESHALRRDPFSFSASTLCISL